MDTTMSQRVGRGLLLGVFVLLLGLNQGCKHATQTRAQAAEVDDTEHLKEVATIGDVTEVANVAPLQISGVGLVMGLEGTGGSPNGNLRVLLEEQLRKQNIKNVKQLLESKDNALVQVTAIVPPGARKGDLMDVEVMLPAGSPATSLRGGHLVDCNLRNFSSKKAVNPEFTGHDQTLTGHILGKAKGQVVIGVGNDDELRQRQAKIWEGAITHVDRPFYLVLKNDQKFARVANLVAERINTMFQEDARKRYEVQIRKLQLLDDMSAQINSHFKTPTLGRNEMAKATKEIVYINVPLEYQLNPERYLRVVRNMPMRETAEGRAKYRQRLAEMLPDPTRTLRASLRLEALGKESIPVLKSALDSPAPMVRFCAAEALTYLGNPSGVATLASMAERYPQLRAYCLTALAGYNEGVTRDRLTELLTSADVETRYGAFRALQILSKNRGVDLRELALESESERERDPVLEGELLNHSFWLHRVAPRSPSLIHFSLQRRAEIVLFGESPRLVPPFKMRAGKEFILSALAVDNRCTITRIDLKSGESYCKQCPLGVDAVLKVMADMGCQYSDAMDMLRSAAGEKCLSCPLESGKVPQPTPLEELLEGCRDPQYLLEVSPTTPDAERQRRVVPQD